MSEYITNKELLELTSEWHNGDRMPERLGEAFLLIARNLSNKSNFIGYTWKDEMIAEAVFTCVKYYRNFDPAKSNNPFAYITRICYNSFLNYIKKQNKHGKVKQILYDQKDMIDHHIFFSYRSIDYTELFKDDIEDEDTRG